MVQREAVYQRDEGLTPETAAALAQLAERFHAKLLLQCDGKQVLLDSLIGILSLDCPQGARLTVLAEGQDAEAGVEAVANLLEGR